jgi:predicted RNA polymerase sigma factor
MKRSPKIVSQLAGRSQKAVQDTVTGCRELAAADLARASLMDTTNGRRRLESSALSWTSRAELIQRLDDTSDARHAIARAEWEDGEAVLKAKGRDSNMGPAS